MTFLEFVCIVLATQKLTEMIFLTSRYPVGLRQEVFQRVERQSMLGLRARDPEIRMKFFLLYHESLLKTLFARLQYIIQLQDWEAVSDIFWLKQGLDLLLAILVEDKPITLAPNSARVPPLVVSGRLPDSSGMQPQAPADVSEAPEDAPLTFDSLVLKHAQFLNEMSKLKVLVVSTCMEPFGKFSLIIARIDLNLKNIVSRYSNFIFDVNSYK